MVLEFDVVVYDEALSIYCAKNLLRSSGSPFFRCCSFYGQVWPIHVRAIEALHLVQHRTWSATNVIESIVEFQLSRLFRT